MEAWKFINYQKLSPVFALGHTTERWGLEPFPGNLFVTTNYWQHTNNSNDSFLPGFSLPYSCEDSDPLSYYRYYGDYGDNGDYYKGEEQISSSVEICRKPQACPDSGCIILVEGIGKNTTGPANSNIIGLSHGISAFFALAIPLAIIMGSSTSSFRRTLDQKLKQKPKPRPKKPTEELVLKPALSPPDLHQFAVSPRRYPDRMARHDEYTAYTAQDVANCSDLLRQMYEAERYVWSMKDAGADEQVDLENKKSQAEALFVEICRIVGRWRKARGTGKWSGEDEQVMMEIYDMVEEHKKRR